jgi:hypothetical protein
MVKLKNNFCFFISFILKILLISFFLISLVIFFGKIKKQLFLLYYNFIFKYFNFLIIIIKYLLKKKFEKKSNIYNYTNNIKKF